MRWIGLLLLAIGLLAGCGGEQGEDAASAAITLQLNWKPEPQFGGFYAAQVNGAYEKAGLTNVTVQPGGVGTPTVQMIGAGQVEYRSQVGEKELVVGALVSGDSLPGGR